MNKIDSKQGVYEYEYEYEYEYPCPHCHNIVTSKIVPHRGIFQCGCGKFFGIDTVDNQAQIITICKIPTDKALEAMRYK